ncbi:hypothetical protein ABID14_000384 [Peptoniphilus olsenii]|uniref:Uncharacterized protein n=1 Tax=Peptoniphilus olsenii TaxID=411570 RepID=A0ABV2JAE0_9FIRM
MSFKNLNLTIRRIAGLIILATINYLLIVTLIKIACLALYKGTMIIDLLIKSLI